MKEQDVETFASGLRAEEDTMSGGPGPHNGQRQNDPKRERLNHLHDTRTEKEWAE